MWYRNNNHCRRSCSYYHNNRINAYEDVRVWIDYDNNGQFSNLSELVLRLIINWQIMPVL